jgi:hypothetical protein
MYLVCYNNNYLAAIVLVVALASATVCHGHVVGDFPKSRLPQKLKRGAFLGFHNKASAQPIMPDGGLSPCIIRVFGVGGGGCNAVDRMLETAVGGGTFASLMFCIGYSLIRA